MMKSSDLQSFVPKDNVGLNLGKTTIYVYPQISEEMLNNEKAYSFLVNKSALESADVSPKHWDHVIGRNPPGSSC